jgi:tetratricopeptide (TPR) repeat protein
MTLLPSLPAFGRLMAFGLGASLLSLLAACASHAPARQKSATIMDLDSLHLVAQHNDSVDANLIFYQEAFETYRKRFPGVDKPAFMAIAKGKDQAFCLFQPDPAKACLDVGNKLNDLGLKDPARDAYEAGLLSEGANEGKLNLLFWSSLAQLHFEAEEYAQAKTYLSKVLEVDPKNKWAKKKLGEAEKKSRG